MRAAIKVKAAEALKTKHRTVHSALIKDIGSSFPHVVWHMETPVFRTAPVPLLSSLKVG
jgi:asparagine synthetase B (glutamine-hydrolysing)